MPRFLSQKGSILQLWHPNSPATVRMHTVARRGGNCYRFKHENVNNASHTNMHINCIRNPTCLLLRSHTPATRTWSPLSCTLPNLREEKQPPPTQQKNSGLCEFTKIVYRIHHTERGGPADLSAAQRPKQRIVPSKARAAQNLGSDRALGPGALASLAIGRLRVQVKQHGVLQREHFRKRVVVHGVVHALPVVLRHRGPNHQITVVVHLPLRVPASAAGSQDQFPSLTLGRKRGGRPSRTSPGRTASRTLSRGARRHTSLRATRPGEKCGSSTRHSISHLAAAKKNDAILRERRLTS